MSIPGCGVRMATLLWSGANRPTHTLETAARRTRRTPNYLEKRANTKDHCRCSLLYLPASPNRFCGTCSVLGTEYMYVPWYDTCIAICTYIHVCMYVCMYKLYIYICMYV